MGVIDRSLLDLVRKARSWISESAESWMSTGGDSAMCRECSLQFSDCSPGHRCRSCGRLFCQNCMRLDEMDQPKFCKFCFKAVGHVETVEEGSEKTDPSVSPERVLESPLFNFSNKKFSRLVEAQQCSSPLSFHCSTCRSDEEEDAEDSGKHFFSPSSEFSQDISDIDSSSISNGHEFYSFKSVTSSPLDSPIRAAEQGETSPMSRKISLLDQETSACIRMHGAGTDDLLQHSNDCVYENLSDFLNHENEEGQQPLDFENTGLIWNPPPPEDEGDDVESGIFGYEDEEDDVGDSGMAFTSCGFSSDAFQTKEKPNDANKELLRASVLRHFRALVSQLLKGEGIHVGNESNGEGWLEIVSSLAWQAANFVKPDTSKGGSMDPGNYVKVKCILSGRPSDSTLIKGIVCTKNVKHKRMISQHRNPKVLLLGGALEYQRVPNKLSSINTVLEQEIYHLKLAVAKIEARRPNVLLVEKSVSSYAQEYLLAKEISLVLNVKKPLLERISRCTGAQIAPSIENVASTRLGQCEIFRIEKVLEQCSSGNNSKRKSTKTLMFFEGCPRRLGCTVLLRGTHREELKKVKHVVQYASFAAYHLSLETSFLADEGATLPKIPLKSPMAIPGRMMSSDTSISMASRSVVANTNQVLLDEQLGVASCNKLGIKCLFPCSNTSSLNNEEILGVHSYQGSADVSRLSLVNSQTHRNFAVASTPDWVLDRAQSSRSGPSDPSDLPADLLRTNDDEVLKDIVEERRRGNHRKLSAVHEQLRTDMDDGNEVPTEYFSTADNHQSILVSFSSSCVLKATVCERSQLLRIRFYGSFDKPLGRYLRDDLFDQASRCRVCNELAEAHVWCYTHQQGSLTISTRRLPSIKLPGERDGRIWMWHRCLKCERKDGIPPAARRVVMSDAAWGLSFGKFLELSFSNHATANRVASCGHSLQRDCLRFYGFGSMVAFFRYTPVDILSVHLPPPVLDFTSQIQQEWARREAVVISSKMEFLHAEVFDVLNAIEQKITTVICEPLKISIYKQFMELKDLLNRERDEYDALLQPATIENIQTGQIAVDILELNYLRRCLLIDSCMWDERLKLLDLLFKSKGYASKVVPLPEILTHTNLKEGEIESFYKDGRLDKPPEGTITKSLTLSEQCEEFSLQVLESNSNDLVKMDLSVKSVEGYSGLSLDSDKDGGWDERDSGVEAWVGRSSIEGLPSCESNLSDKIDLAWTGTGQSMTARLPVGPEADTTGSLNLMDNACYRRVMSPVRVYSFDSALRFRDRKHGGLSHTLHLSSVKSFDAVRDYASTNGDAIPDTQRRCSQRSFMATQRLDFLLPHTPLFVSSASHMVSEGARLLLPQTGRNNIVIAVYDNEPTSIISYAINSQEYADFIACKSDQIEGGNGNEKIKENDVGNMTSSSQQYMNKFHLGDIQPQYYGADEPLPKRGSIDSDPKGSHFRISFDDESSFPAEKAKFSVTCYFAKQFDSLRKKCCANELEFIRSLSRCKTWSAQGGKSHVYFAKSLDERFIIKQVTKTELDSFEDFAPKYFHYLTKSISSQSPTCLAKVLGIYQVTVKHLKGGREVKMDLMVMENLFFRRKISRVYDLKGSLRSRYNPDTTGNNNVLLDLNLLEALSTKPILLGGKAKRNLERAVWNDTSFLASVDVMDYSLLVGVDEEKKELVLGIIDYLRQYTWDKHLETWVKASGILGGLKNASPTVISPLQYKKRFRKAMTKYFLTVPDQRSS